MQPVGEQHEIFTVTITDPKNGAHDLFAVTAFAVRRPDNQWALLAINKDPKRAGQLNVQFEIAGAQRPLSFVGQVEIIQFSRAQYTWRDNGPHGHPIRSMPPMQFTREASEAYELPPYSLTILRGNVAN